MTRHFAPRLALAAGLLLAPAALAASSQDAPQAQGAPQTQATPQDMPAGVTQRAVPPSATAAHVKAAHVKKRTGRHPVRRPPRGYGFLPGYEPPPPVDRYGNPVGPGAAYRYAWDGPRYWSRGRWYYGWGGPRFFRGRWNGGGFGPCWTQTPIGMMWNCGR